MYEHHKHVTPMREDKRLLLTVSVVFAVLVLSGFGHEPSEQILTFIGLTVAAYMGQSQYGQTKRATSAPLPRADDPDCK